MCVCVCLCVCVYYSLALAPDVDTYISLGMTSSVHLLDSEGALQHFLAVLSTLFFIFLLFLSSYYCSVHLLDPERALLHFLAELFFFIFPAHILKSPLYSAFV